MQKFFTDTIESKFIKAFLHNTPIPYLNTVSDGDYLVSGMEYLYKSDIIRCIKNGYLRPYKIKENYVDKKCFYKYIAEEGIPSDKWINLEGDLYFYDYDYKLILKYPKHMRIKITSTTGNQNSFILNPIKDDDLGVTAIVGEAIAGLAIAGTTVKIPYNLTIYSCADFTEQWLGTYQIKNSTIEQPALYSYISTTAHTITSNVWTALKADLCFYVNNKLVLKFPKFSTIRVVDKDDPAAIFTIDSTGTGKLNINRNLTISYSTKDSYLGNITIQTLPEDECEVAEYIKVKDYMFESENLEFAQTYKSNYKYYDSDTHYHLGNYLRAYRDIYGIDLMPLYNCFNYKAVDNFYFETDNGSIKVNDGVNSNYKLLAVPIKFNKTYTIAFEANSQIVLKSVFYNDLGLIKVGGTDAAEYLHDSITKGDRIFSQISFKKPFIYKVETSNKNLLQNEKYLYLIIQVSRVNDSSLVVLEGDYRYLNGKTINLQYDKYLSYKEANNYYLSDLSLLTINDHNQYAFADTLIQYLLWQVITPRDEISLNIKRVQEFLLNKSSYYKKLFNNKEVLLGVWDSATRNELFNLYKNSKNTSFKDFFGYVDRDVEAFINKG